MSDPNVQNSNQDQNRGADIYNSNIGNTSGALIPNYKDSGKDHVTNQFEKTARVSYDVDINTGEISGVHGNWQNPSSPW